MADSDTASRLGGLEARLAVLEAMVSKIDAKQDVLYENLYKGRGAFWLASVLLGIGAAIGGVLVSLVDFKIRLFNGG